MQTRLVICEHCSLLESLLRGCKQFGHAQQPDIVCWADIPSYCPQHHKLPIYSLFNVQRGKEHLTSQQCLSCYLTHFTSFPTIYKLAHVTLCNCDALCQMYIFHRGVMRDHYCFTSETATKETTAPNQYLCKQVSWPVGTPSQGCNVLSPRVVCNPQPGQSVNSISLRRRRKKKTIENIEVQRK